MIRLTDATFDAAIKSLAIGPLRAFVKDGTCPPEEPREVLRLPKGKPPPLPDPTQAGRDDMLVPRITATAERDDDGELIEVAVLSNGEPFLVVPGNVALQVAMAMMNVVTRKPQIAVPCRRCRGASSRSGTRRSPPG